MSESLNLTAIESTKRLVAEYNESGTFDTSFSGVFQVTVDGEAVFRQAIGIVDEEHQLPMTMDAVFPIGSNTKLFTAVALYQLQEQGKVNLSQPINEDLTQEDFAKFGFPNQTSWCPLLQDMPDGPCINITYEQLLSMSSGMGNNQTLDFIGDYKGSVEAYVGLFINDPLLFMPGTNYSYSNPSFILATYMIEKFSGMKYGYYLKKYIFKPLGLNNTFYDPYDGQLSIIKNYADQYWRFFANDTGKELGVGVCKFFSSGAVSGTGGIIASVDDLIKWYLDLFSSHGTASKVLSENSIRQIIKPWTMVPESDPEVYFGQGVGVTYANGTNSSYWPSEVLYSGSTLCATTTIAMQIFNSESSTITAAFANHQIVVFDSKETYEDLKKNINTSFNSFLIPFLMHPAPLFEDDQWAVFLYGGNDGFIVPELLEIWTST